MITLPPHCTHKMQPLDRTFFKWLKANYNRAADNFMTTNVGKRITFYEMADIFGKAYGISATVEKAVKGFETTGIWPFDDNKFGEEDFAAADMTDEPLPAAVSGGIESLSGNEELGLEAIVAHTNSPTLMEQEKHMKPLLHKVALNMYAQMDRLVVGICCTRTLHQMHLLHHQVTFEKLLINIISLRLVM